MKKELTVNAAVYHGILAIDMMVSEIEEKLEVIRPLSGNAETLLWLKTIGHRLGGVREQISRLPEEPTN